MSPPTFADAFRAHRLALGLSQVAVARLWDTSGAWVCRVEAGGKWPTVANLADLATGDALLCLLRLRALETGRIDLRPHPTEEGLAHQIALQAAGGGSLDGLI